MTPNEDMDDVTHTYQRTQTPDDGPPAALDDAIRAAARRAVHSRPQPAGQGWITRWRTPLSAAAVMVLAVSVVFVAIDEKPDVAPASMQKVTQELREAAPAAPAKKDEAAVAVLERAPLQTKIIPADSLRPVPAPEVQIESPALPRERKVAQAGSGAMADSNLAPRAEEAARNQAVAVAKEKSNADLAAGRRDVAAAPPPAQAAVVGAVAAVAPMVVPAPAAPVASPAPAIAFAPPPPTAVAPAPARMMASAPASVPAPAPVAAATASAAPVVSNTSPVIVIDRAKLAEALAKPSAQEPAKPAEATEARYATNAGAARQFAKAEATRDALPPPAAVAPQIVAASKKQQTETITVTGSTVQPPAVAAKDAREPVVAAGSRIASPVYAPPSPAVKSLAEQKESAEAWIKRIEQLFKDGRPKEAREELARFRRAYPNATLPSALARLPAE